MMVLKKELIIIRHARSMHNCGQTDCLDSPITKWGDIQSKVVGQFLSSNLDLSDFEFYTSPFLRCLQTAYNFPCGTFRVSCNLREYINHDGVDGEVVNIKPRIEEFSMGNFDWGNFREERTYQKETNEQLVDRLYEFYYNLPEKSLVITHGLPALVLSHIATNTNHVIPVWDYSLDNCSITRIVNGRYIWRGRNLHYENFLVTL
jgi:broad specificity phosphatase PhoE